LGADSGWTTTESWIVENREEFTALVSYLQTLGRAKDWRPDKDYEK